MNIDINATTFFEPSRVLTFLAKFLGGNSATYFDNAVNRKLMLIRDIFAIEKVLKNIKVCVTHRGDMRRKYKVLAFTRFSSDQVFFRFNDKDISVMQYFQEHYNMTLRHPFLPCLIVGNIGRPVYLPIEVCDIVPGQRYLKKLNEPQTSQIIRLTC